jgi:hypothetical protein
MVRSTGWAGAARWVGVLACALLVASIAASRAYASSSSFGIERYGLTATEKDDSVDTQAGSHPYELTAEAVLDPNLDSMSADEVRSLDFELPPGLTINLATVPQDGIVGMAQASIAGEIASATVYKLAPLPGELARLEFTLEGVRVIAEISVRLGSDNGMTLSIQGFPPRNIESVKMTLGGAMTSPFVTLPTSCAEPLQTTLQGESWGGETTSQSASFPQMTGCNRLAFQPAMSVVSDGAEADEPSGYQVRLSMPQNEGLAGLSAAQLRDASVTLPGGASLSLSAADGLSGCEEAQVALDSNESTVCANSSKVGEVKIETPLLAHPLEGAVFLATPNANPLGALVALYLVAEEPESGATIKLAGQIALDASTGQPTLTFDDLPQLPIGEIELELFGGARALLSTPAACGLATATSELTPWSGSAPVSASSSFEIDSGANGTSCSEQQPFSPTFQAGSTTGGTGAFDSLTFVLARADQEEELSTIAIQAPQAVAEMFAAVPLCGEAQASAGTCPAASAIGPVALAVGPGPEPYDLGGEVYLTGPYRGASQGLSIVVPFDAGPFELGNVVIRASEQIDPHTGRMTILSDPLPTIFDGIPLRLRDLALQLDRGEFEPNPDGCEPLTITGTITSTGGRSVAVQTEPLGASSSQCTPPQGGAPITTPGVTPASATVTLAGTRILTTSEGKALFELTCTGTSTCHGTLTLNVETRGTRGKKRRSKTTTIGTVAFSIQPGKTTATKVKLNPAGRALLGADHGRLTVKLTIFKSSPGPAQTRIENVRLVRRKAVRAKKP